MNAVVNRRAPWIFKMAEFAMITDVLNELKLKRKGQFLENIEELLNTNHQWDSNKTIDELEKAVAGSLLKKVKVNDRFSYRLVKDNIHFEDISTEASENVHNVPNESEKNIDALASDFEEFKKFIMSEVSIMKDMFASTKKCLCNHNTSLVSSNKSDDSIAISCLKDHIKSLERELSAKQEIINKLLDKSEYTEKPPSKNKNKIKKGVSELNDSKTLISTSKNSQKNENIVIIGDSMINGLNAKGFKDRKVLIKAHPGATTEDLIHYIKPVVNKKPNKIIIHCGTNDIPKDIKSIDNYKQIDDYIKINSPDTKMILSTIITRKDNANYDAKVDAMNERIKKFTNKNNIDLLDHSNIHEKLLNQKKLHLNKRGYSYLANNIISYLKN